jgi:hypothetical protein
VFPHAESRRFNDHVFARSGDGWRVSVATPEAVAAYADHKRELVRRAAAAVCSASESSVDCDVPPPERL